MTDTKGINAEETKETFLFEQEVRDQMEIDIDELLKLTELQKAASNYGLKHKGGDISPGSGDLEILADQLQIYPFGLEFDQHGVQPGAKVHGMMSFVVDDKEQKPQAMVINELFVDAVPEDGRRIQVCHFKNLRFGTRQMKIGGQDLLLIEVWDFVAEVA